jgi:hypothetical protein
MTIADAKLALPLPALMHREGLAAHAKKSARCPLHDDKRALFGISRSKLYELITAGHIRSVSLRKRGQVKGTRLIQYDSLCAFLEAAYQNEGVIN